MKVEGSLQAGENFEFCDSSLSRNAPFIALVAGGAICGQSFKHINHLPDETVVIACWHGKRKTDGFLTTVGELRSKAEKFKPIKKGKKVIGYHSIKLPDGSWKKYADHQDGTSSVVTD